jgi:hypothetical protein
MITIAVVARHYLKHHTPPSLHHTLYLILNTHCMSVQAEELERPQFHGTHFEDFESTVSGQMIKTKTSVKASSKGSTKEKGKGRSGVRGRGFDGEEGGLLGEDGEREGAELRKAYPIWRRLVR